MLRDYANLPIIPGLKRTTTVSLIGILFNAWLVAVNVSISYVTK